MVLKKIWVYRNLSHSACGFSHHLRSTCITSGNRQTRHPETLVEPVSQNPYCHRFTPFHYHATTCTNAAVVAPRRDYARSFSHSRPPQALRCSEFGFTLYWHQRELCFHSRSNTGKHSPVSINTFINPGARPVRVSTLFSGGAATDYRVLLEWGSIHLKVQWWQSCQVMTGGLIGGVIFFF